MSSKCIKIPYPVQHSWIGPFRFLKRVTWVLVAHAAGAWFLAIWLISTSLRCWGFVRSDRTSTSVRLAACVTLSWAGNYSWVWQEVADGIGRWIPSIGHGCCGRVPQVGWWGCLGPRVHLGPYLTFDSRNFNLLHRTVTSCYNRIWQIYKLNNVTLNYNNKVYLFIFYNSDKLDGKIIQNYAAIVVNENWKDSLFIK